MKNWKDVRYELYTDEEIKESNMRVDIVDKLIKIRNKRLNGAKTYSIEETLKMMDSVIEDAKSKDHITLN